MWYKTPLFKIYFEAFIDWNAIWTGLPNFVKFNEQILRYCYLFRHCLWESADKLHSDCSLSTRAQHLRAYWDHVICKRWLKQNKFLLQTSKHFFSAFSRTFFFKSLISPAYLFLIKMLTCTVKTKSSSRETVFSHLDQNLSIFVFLHMGY